MYGADRCATDYMRTVDAKQMQGSAGWENGWSKQSSNYPLRDMQPTNRCFFDQELNGVSVIQSLRESDRAALENTAFWLRMQAFAGDCRDIPVVRSKGLAFRYCRLPMPTPRAVSKKQAYSECCLW